MDLSTTYLGFELPHPLVAGASPLVDDLDMVRRLEDAGAAAIVLHSLFEEQIDGERQATFAHHDAVAESFGEATTFFPRASEFALGPDAYLERIRAIKAAVDVPVIGSLNGTTPSGWLRYAGLIEQAGADALELNVYEVAIEPERDGRVRRAAAARDRSRREERRQDPDRRQALALLQLAREPGARDRARGSETGSWSSTGSISPTSTPRGSNTRPRSTSLIRPSSCSDFTGSRFSRGGSTLRSLHRAAFTRRSTR